MKTRRRASTRPAASRRRLALLTCLLALAAVPAAAQTHDMSHMGHDMAAMEHHHEGGMNAMYGPYPMTREASGTSWQPDLARHEGIHAMKGAWMFMLHGFADVTLNDQGGPRGDEKVFGSNMLMGMAQRSLGPGRLGFRAMLSAEPATIGKEGYPLLLQTGETADGVTHLIDRQHPHDLFMELAATYSLSRGNRSLFLYAGLPGEPALGPPAFMHRFSGAAFPQAPISHHWLDSSHITFGVLTAGVVVGRAKFEASAFRGREPDEARWNIESPELDSHSFRVSLNPSPGWSLQASRGRLTSPEELEPEIDVDRTTLSATHAADWGAGHWESTIAWGRNKSRPGPTLDAVAVESALKWRDAHTFFARVERAEKNELFAEGESREGEIFSVGQASAGYRFDFWRRKHAATGIGVFGSVSLVPSSIRDVYGDNPASGMLFLRTDLR
ncbi:MAG TPA: hypothetical protein VFU59_07520 [Candidatus Eisenbacteria bacterium]|nr:hypothetical protein [Candidatus Eisenbacteria bacterium]